MSLEDPRQLEQQLQRYRPAGPSAELRERVIGSIAAVRLKPDATNGIWWQIAAAFILLAAGTVLHTATAKADRQIAAAIGPTRSVEDARIEELTRVLGEDANAWLIAQAMLAREVERTTAPMPEVPQ